MRTVAAVLATLTCLGVLFFMATTAAKAGAPLLPDILTEPVLTPLSTTTPESVPEKPSRAPRTPEVPVAREYVEVVQGCGPYFEGPCVNVRTGPGSEYAVAEKLRMGAVVEVDGAVFAEGRTWYRVTHKNEWLRYPERSGVNRYVASDYVRHFIDDSAVEIPVGSPAEGDKHIIVDRSEQMLYAYDGDDLYKKIPISSGLNVTPTPRGTFTIYKKTPSRYMQGPIPGISDQYYDLPGVPWNLYFTAEGAVVHGAYWHDKFGQPWSHGCVNLSPDMAQDIYHWADVGTQIIVRD